MATRRTAVAPLDLDHDLLIRNTAATITSKAKTAPAVMRDILRFARGKTGVSTCVGGRVLDDVDKASIANPRSLAD